MAIPNIIWGQPLNSGTPGTPATPESSPGAGDGTPATPAIVITVADSHILRNDLVTISRKAPATPAVAPSTYVAGKYFARFNDVDYSFTPAVTGSPNPDDNSPSISAYTFVDRGHISLEGGVWELLPFSSGVSPATTVTYTDFAGTGHSPYPVSYSQSGTNSTEAGILLCGAKANVESTHAYSISPMNIYSSPGTTYGTGANAWTGTPASGTTPGTSNPATLTGTIFTSAFGVSSAPQVTYYYLTNGGVGSSPGEESGPGDTGYALAAVNQTSEQYTVGGSYHNGGTSPADIHTGSILFEVRYDTLATIDGGNERKTVAGTASWAAGQGRSVTFTTSSDHLLADANNRVYISGASNNAINGLWNVAAVTNSTVFTTTIFGAHCGPSAITSDVTIETYDGIDKAGGVLKQLARVGTITSIVERKVGHAASGSPSSPGYVAAYHEIYHDYTGSHGVGVSGIVSINIDSTSSGTASDFDGNITRTSGTVLTATLANGSGNVTSSTTIWSGSAGVFDSANNVEIIGGGVYGNNQVLLAGSVAISPGDTYSFHGNSTTGQVSTIYFTGATTQKSMLDDAGFKLDTGSGRIYTNNAPSTQPSGTDGMPGGFDASTNPTGGVKEIDSWCPKYAHAKQKALERADITELLKANTTGKFSLDQLINSPIVDAAGLVTTLLLPRDGLHETCWFTIRAFKNPSHRRTNTYVENEDYIDRRFGINVYSNSNSDRNEIILDYIDITNKVGVANTDSSFSKTVDEESVAITNTEHLALGYANGTFKNQ